MFREKRSCPLSYHTPVMYSPPAGTVGPAAVRLPDPEPGLTVDEARELRRLLARLVTTEAFGGLERGSCV